MQTQFESKEEILSYIKQAEEKIKNIGSLDGEEFYMFLEYTTEGILKECKDVFLKIKDREDEELIHNIGRITDKALIIISYMQARSAGGTDDADIIRARTINNMEYTTKKMYENAMQVMGERK